MNKNSYVTAALFVVFVLLTVLYWNMGGDDHHEGQFVDGGPATITLNDTNTQAAADLIDNEDAEVREDDEAAEAEETMLSENISSIQAVRSELERQRSLQVAALTEIIASPDHDAATKSAAKDDLNALERQKNSGRTLEALIKSMGFSDVLVRANDDAVQVTIQIQNLESAPSREELAELYVLAGLEFTNHRNGNIFIDFQPLD